MRTPFGSWQTAANASGKRKMKENNEESVEETEEIRILSETRRYCEENFAEVKDQIESHFDQLAKQLDRRKTRLLRQAEAIHRQQECLIHENKPLVLKGLPRCSLTVDDYEELESMICRIGKLELDSDAGCIMDLEPCKMSEYADKDFECFDKKIGGGCESWNVQVPRVFKSKGCYGKIEDEKGRSTVSLDLVTPTVAKDKHGMTYTHSEPQEIFHCIEDKTNPTARSNKEPNSVAEHEASSGDFKEANEAEISRTIASCDCSIEDNHCCREAESQATAEEFTPASGEAPQEAAIVQEVGSEENSKMSPKERSEHPEQVKQWLEQILRETEIEPSINEVDKIALQKLSLVN